MLLEIRDANLLYTTVAVAPIQPAVVNTSGENEPCSISLILSSYFLFLHFLSSVALFKGVDTMALSEWVKNPYVEKCLLPIFPPEILRHNV